MSLYESKSPYRSLVVGSETKVPLSNGRMSTVINFDNAATTPPLVSVMNAMNRFAPWYSSIHRGTGYKSKLSSNLYDKSRDMVLNFVGADADEYTVIYVKNTTEALNMLCNMLCTSNHSCSILTTSMEHHSNDLPWRNNYNVIYADIDSHGRLDLNDLEKKLKANENTVKLVAITGASNVTGCINPVHDIARLVHNYGGRIVVDGAQLIPHKPFSITSSNPNESIDFLAFSAHKMYSPFGIGVLIGPKKVLNELPPHYSGGGTVKLVTQEYVLWDDAPARHEAGTPNVIGSVALGTAIETLSHVGMENIFRYEETLLQYAYHRLSRIEGIELIDAECSCHDKVSIIPFNVSGMYHQTVAEILSTEGGIAVRSGCFCAHPYVQKLLDISSEEMDFHKKFPDSRKPGLVRLSFGMYNDTHEIDVLAELLKHLVNHRDYYLEKYGD